MQKMQEEKYNNNKLIGSGFMMPYISNYSSLGLEMSLNVEPGNLIWCLRGDVGIIGTIVFVLFLVSILLFGNFKYLSLLISSIGVCMGEMVFFSVNSIGILLYVLIAIYLVSCTSNKKGDDLNEKKINVGRYFKGNGNMFNVLWTYWKS